MRPQLAALDKFTTESERVMVNELHQWLLNEQDTTQRLLEQIDLMLEQLWIQRELLQQAVAEDEPQYLLVVGDCRGVLTAQLFDGVFGINIGGMPGVENEAFGTTTPLIIAVIEFLLLQRLRFCPQTSVGRASGDTISVMGSGANQVIRKVESNTTRWSKSTSMRPEFVFKRLMRWPYRQHLRRVR